MKFAKIHIHEYIITTKNKTKQNETKTGTTTNDRIYHMMFCGYQKRIEVIADKALLIDYQKKMLHYRDYLFATKQIWSFACVYSAILAPKKYQWAMSIHLIFIWNFFMKWKKKKEKINDQINTISMLWLLAQTKHGLRVLPPKIDRIFDVLMYIWHRNNTNHITQLPVIQCNFLRLVHNFDFIHSQITTIEHETVRVCCTHWNTSMKREVCKK